MPKDTFKRTQNIQIIQQEAGERTWEQKQDKWKTQ